MKLSMLSLLLLPGILFSQEYFSKVAVVAGQTVKIENRFSVSDEEIIMNSAGQEFPPFVVENFAPGNYETLYAGKIPVNIVINEFKGKAKGFKYTHTLSISASDKTTMPDSTYYCILEE